MLFSGCKPIQKAGEELAANAAEVLAVAGAQEITVDDLEYWAGRRNLDHEDPAQRQQILDAIILRRAHAERALAAGLHLDPEVRSSYEGLLISRLKEIELMEAVANTEIEESDLRAAYAEVRGERFTQPAEYEVAVLWFQTRGQQALETRFVERLQIARQQMLEQPIPLEEGFGALSITNTEHRASRFKGGRLGWLPEQAYPDALRKQALAVARQLEVGQLSEVTVTADEVLLVRLMDRREQRFRDFEEVKEVLRKELVHKQREALESAFDQKSLDTVEIQRF